MDEYRYLELGRSVEQSHQVFLVSPIHSIERFRRVYLEPDSSRFDHEPHLLGVNTFWHSSYESNISINISFCFLNALFQQVRCYSWWGLVWHVEHRGHASKCPRHCSRGKCLLVGLPEIPQVHVNINEARDDEPTFTIYDIYIFLSYIWIYAFQKCLVCIFWKHQDFFTDQY